MVCEKINDQSMISNAIQKTQFVSVVAYIHNDEARIPYFIDTVMDKCCKSFKQCEVVFVDDHSTDNSVKAIKEYYQKNPVNYIVSIIRLGKYHGMEVAMNAGRDMAIGDYVYEFDSLFIDFDLDVLIQAYDKCLEGNDVVVAATDVPLRFTSKMFYKMFNKVTTTSAQIGQESFRLLSRRGINRVISMDVDIPYRKVIYLNCGLSSARINYKSTTGERPARITKHYERLNLALTSFIYFTDIAERFALFASILFAVFSTLTGVYAIISRIAGYHVGTGWLSMILFVCIGFAVLFAIMALIVKYLAIIVDLVFEKQKYLITDVDKISSM